MIRAIILDDEKHCSDTLKLMLEKHLPDITVVAEMNDPVKALDELPPLEPDLLFLDIEMPRLTGFQFLKKLPHLDFEIIFTTAYDDFAIRAFRVSAIDYLMKPIERGELLEAYEKFKKYRTEKDFGERFRVFMSQYGSLENRALGKVALPTQEGFEFIGQEEIIRCESDSNYTEVILDDRKIVVSKTLKEVQAMLDEDAFVRVHHSHLINLRHIQKYQKGSGGTITMANGDAVSVSRGKKSDFLGRF